jgi:hypothetical protein
MMKEVGIINILRTPLQGLNWLIEVHRQADLAEILANIVLDH